MKNTALYFSLLLVCLPPCAAQVKTSPSQPLPKIAVPCPAAGSRPFSAAGSWPFSDVPKDHWAAAAVETLRQRGIVTGYPAAPKKQKP